ncbi:HAMP domain-containing sensor histidine kinase [uncultured Acetatifactor sp.]|uniref:sensor histidine kinase n=1 Tax=uncultured Acetatifactor sp. TaxID=1671927 RepID=UPI00261DD59A|nr:HAMP domain-containing sensor histidine kinase [uncultured Acetatifactor sp.]
MSRSKGPVRLGMRRQMLLIILALFLAGGGILGSGIHAKLWQSLEAQIVRELTGQQENTLVYIRQLLMLHGANNDEEGFRQIAEDIVQELRVLGGQAMSVLDTKGQYLSGSRQVQEDPAGTDLAAAMEGNAAFTLTYPDADTMLVYFSMPVTIEDHTIGIIRYRMDTSRLYLQIRQNEQMIYQITAAVYALIFLLLAFFLGRLLVPVGKLTEITRQVVRDLSKGQVDMQMLAQLADSGRRDEVGELSRNFSVMLETIGSQLEKMQADKEQIVSLLGSRQEFYNNMTHELKTPLTTIQGYAQLMEADRGADPKLTSQGLSQILQESTRMHRMVLQLLEMSDKGIYMEMRPVELAGMAGSVAGALEIKARRYEMRIETDFPDPLWAMGVEERLRQVLVNLVDNAIKYGDSHTPILLSGSRRKGYVWLFVRNQGKGLSPEEQERIFEPFYRVDKLKSREQGSSGLGLSICRKIMEEHDGLIGVKSSGNDHTTFYIRLKEIPDADGNREDWSQAARNPQEEKAEDHDAQQAYQAKNPKTRKSPVPRLASRQSASP